ncbi:hypothetical protein AMTR_s00005p00235450, partial [Amborella trichopoda]
GIIWYVIARTLGTGDVDNTGGQCISVVGSADALGTGAVENVDYQCTDTPNVLCLGLHAASCMAYNIMRPKWGEWDGCCFIRASSKCRLCYLTGPIFTGPMPSVEVEGVSEAGILGGLVRKRPKAAPS